MKSPTLLGVQLSTLNREQILNRVSDFLSSQAFNHLATVNPEFLVEAAQNKPFKDILNTTALNVVDGTGIKLWGKGLYGDVYTRFTGVELAENICELAATQKKSVYFLGGFDVAKKAAAIMQAKYPTLIVVGAEDGSPTIISENLKKAQPDVLLVAFGAPAQELWINKFKSDLPSTKLAVGIGGTFDFWTGKAKRAPQIIRRVGLEWLWRLITQPKRAKRIWRAVVVFSWLIVKEKLSLPR